MSLNVVYPQYKLNLAGYSVSPVIQIMFSSLFYSSMKKIKYMTFLLGLLNFFLSREIPHITNKSNIG